MTKGDKISFGKRVNTVRKEQKLSSNALSEICGVDPAYVRMIERGARTPSLPVFIKICNALRVSPGVLLTDCLEPADEEQYDSICKRMQELTPKQAEIVTAMMEAMIDKLEA